MRAWMWIACVTSCHAPPVEVAARDAGSEVEADVSAAEDAKVCAPVRKLDGGVCQGPDEDQDCVPDECDDCPNVPQEPVVVAHATDVAGEACTHPKLESITKRRFFDGFLASYGPWIDDSGMAVAGERFHVQDGAGVLGLPTGGYAAWRIAHLAIDLGASDVVATGIVRVSSLSEAGVALRVTKPDTAPRGYVCTTGFGGRFRIAAITCSGTKCDAVTVRDATSGALAEKVLPESLGMSPERLLLRAYAVNEGASVKLGCQAFPVPASPSDVPGTLRAVTSASTLTATVADPLYADGDVGVFVRGVQLTLESIDVLTP